MRIAICDDNEIQIGIFMHRINNFLKRNGDIKALITPYDKGQPLIDDVADGEWYDIVVLDIVLREENGIEVAKELRLNGYDGNIIFWTAHKEYVFEALDLLPIHYIIKGSENGRMYTAFNHALEHISKSTLMIKGKDFIHRPKAITPGLFPFQPLCFAALEPCFMPFLACHNKSIRPSYKYLVGCRLNCFALTHEMG